eukprot:gene3215-617_t
MPHPDMAHNTVFPQPVHALRVECAQAQAQSMASGICSAISALLEEWVAAYKLANVHAEDVWVMSWAHDGFVLCSGCVQGMLVVWDVAKESPLHRVEHAHQHFIQGITADPLGVYFALQSRDRSISVWAKNRLMPDSKHAAEFPAAVVVPAAVSAPEGSKKKLKNKGKGHNPWSLCALVRDLTDPNAGEKEGASSLFRDETVMSFFRHLAFSPDGLLLVCPTGQWKVASASGLEVYNCCWVFLRGVWKEPIMKVVLQAGSSEEEFPPILGVRFAPLFFELRPDCTVSSALPDIPKPESAVVRSSSPPLPSPALSAHNCSASPPKLPEATSEAPDCTSLPIPGNSATDTTQRLSQASTRDETPTKPTKPTLIIQPAKTWAYLSGPGPDPTSSGDAYRSPEQKLLHPVLCTSVSPQIDQASMPTASEPLSGLADAAISSAPPHLPSEDPAHSAARGAHQASLATAGVMATDPNNTLRTTSGTSIPTCSSAATCDQRQTDTCADASSQDVLPVSTTASHHTQQDSLQEKLSQQLPFPQGSNGQLHLPYRMVYCVWTRDTIWILDSQSPHAQASIGGLHLAPITDVTWSADASQLLVSSKDGFVSSISTDMSGQTSQAGSKASPVLGRTYAPQSQDLPAALRRVFDIQYELASTAPPACSQPEATGAIPPPQSMLGSLAFTMNRILPQVDLVSESLLPRKRIPLDPSASSDPLAPLSNTCSEMTMLQPRKREPLQPLAENTNALQPRKRACLMQESTSPTSHPVNSHLPTNVCTGVSTVSPKPVVANVSSNGTCVGETAISVAQCHPSPDPFPVSVEDRADP